MYLNLVAITSTQQIQQLQNSEQTSTTWQINLQNTGLLSTNASIVESALTLSKMVQNQLYVVIRLSI